MSEIKLTEMPKEKLFEIISDKNFKIMELYQEIKRLNNIIKEAREYIEDDRLYMSNGNVLSIANTGCGKKLLEILDKEKDNGKR